MLDIIIILTGKLFVLLAGIVSLNFLTTFFSPSQVATLNQLMAICTLITSGLLIPPIVYYSRGMIGWIEDGSNKTKTIQILGFLLIGSIPLISIIVLINIKWNLVREMSSWWFGILVWLYLIAFPLNTLLANSASIMAERVRGAIYSALTAWTSLALGIFFSKKYFNIEWWILGSFLGLFITTPGLTHLLNKKSNKINNFSLNYTKLEKRKNIKNNLKISNIIYFCLPQILVFFIWWLQSQSHRFILPVIENHETVALVFIAYALSSVPMQAFESAMSEYATNKLILDSGENGQNAISAWENYVDFYIPTIMMFGGYLTIMLPIIGINLIGSKFQSILPILFIPVISETARAISSVIHAFGIAKIDMKSLLPVVGVGCLISIVSLLLLVNLIEPLLGTVLSLMLGSISSLTVVVIIMKNKYKANWNYALLIKYVLLSTPLVILSIKNTSEILDNSYKMIIILLISTIYFLSIFYQHIKKYQI